MRKRGWKGGRKSTELGDSERPKGKGDRKGKDDKGKGREAAASAKEAEVAWMATTTFSDDEDENIPATTPYPDLNELLWDDDNISIANSRPDLKQLKVSDDEGDLEKREVSEEWDDWEEDRTEPTVVIDSGDAAYTTTFDAGMLTRNSLGSDLINMELFDSGASRHMTGHRKCLTNFTEIKARPITAADKRTFNATGKEDMYVY